MTDLDLDKVKSFFDRYATLDEFTKLYIDVHNPSNTEAMIQLFCLSKGTDNAWKLTKLLRSEETLRLDKMMPKKATINDIINKTKEYDLNKYKRIMIKLDNKNYDDLDSLSTLGIDICIMVSGDKDICTIEEFKKMREYFNFFVNSYSTYNLSNLEKITLAYDYVKFFSYNEQQGNKLTESRSIVKSINSGHIVCEGYSRIFCQLLSEMGIDSNLLFTEPTKKDIGGHVRVILNVNDKKYGISGDFVFDPTWDANKDMYFVSHSDETTGYEIESWLKQGDTIIEKMPSDIRYLFFMVPLHEYSKYFADEKIEKIQKYPSGESIQLTNDIIEKIEYNDGNPKDDFIFNFIQDLIYKTKKIEGYNDEQIENNIHHITEILKQDRYGRYDKNNTRQK